MRTEALMVVAVAIGLPLLVRRLAGGCEYVTENADEAIGNCAHLGGTVRVRRFPARSPLYRPQPLGIAHFTLRPCKFRKELPVPLP